MYVYILFILKDPVAERDNLMNAVQPTHPSSPASPPSDVPDDPSTPNSRTAPAVPTDGEAFSDLDESGSECDSYDISSDSEEERDDELSNFDAEYNFDWLEDVAENTDDEQLRLDVKSDLTKWAIECGIPRTHVNRLLIILRKCNELSSLPKDYRSLLKTVRHVVTKDVNPGTYFHFGLSAGILRSLFHLNLQTIPAKLEICVHIDGIPLSKSSNSQFWPILAMIRGFNNSIPFVVGIFHGSSKPLSANDYLIDFVTEAKELETNGIEFRDSKILVTFPAFICDFPARTFVLCTKGHMGYFGCGKCETEGSQYNPNVNNPKSGRVTFPQLNALPRTNESFRDQSQP